LVQIFSVIFIIAALHNYNIGVLTEDVKRLKKIIMVLSIGSDNCRQELPQIDSNR